MLALAGCNFGGDKGADVEKRAQDRWNLLIAHQAEKAYDYLTPGTRETQTRENYAASMNSRPVKWTAAKFNRKECDADRCKVYIDVSYSVVAPGAGAMGKPLESVSTQSETWVYVDNEWYFLPK
ncbi:MAG: hypothetical protein ACREPX_02215 [Rhodanobacteraceae bacterium]